MNIGIYCRYKFGKMSWHSSGGYRKRAWHYVLCARRPKFRVRLCNCLALSATSVLLLTEICITLRVLKPRFRIVIFSGLTMPRTLCVCFKARDVIFAEFLRTSSRLRSLILT